MSLNDFRDEVHSYATDKGWWDEPRTFGDLIALCHSELSEALEEFRLGNMPNYTYYEGNKPEGVPSELIDVFIRIFDMAGHYGIDLDYIYESKMQYNRSRKYRHGGKSL